MTKTKVLAGFLLVLAVLFAQVGSAAAAPQTQDGTTTVSGTVIEIGTPQTQNGTTTVLVTLEAADGTKTTVRVSEEVAAGLTLNETATLTVNASSVVPPEQEDVHPVAKLLGGFFDVSASAVNEYHQDGFGFGVIAQALWLSKDLSKDGNADPALAGEILDAKKNKSFDEFFTAHPELLPDGATAPTNWGQFKKALREDKRENLGAAVSHPNESENSSDQQKNGKGQGNDKGSDNGNGKGNNNGNGKGQGQGNNGNGPHPNKGKGKP